MSIPTEEQMVVWEGLAAGEGLGWLDEMVEAMRTAMRSEWRPLCHRLIAAPDVPPALRNVASLFLAADSEDSIAAERVPPPPPTLVATLSHNVLKGLDDDPLRLDLAVWVDSGVVTGVYGGRELSQMQVRVFVVDTNTQGITDRLTVLPDPHDPSEPLPCAWSEVTVETNQALVDRVLMLAGDDQRKR